MQSNDAKLSILRSTNSMFFAYKMARFHGAWPGVGWGMAWCGLGHGLVWVGAWPGVGWGMAWCGLGQGLVWVGAWPGVGWGMAWCGLGYLPTIESALSLPWNLFKHDSVCPLPT